MRSIARAFLTIVAATSLLAGQAHAAAPLNTYFHCMDGQTTPVGNVNLIADGYTPVFTDTAPTGSLSAGDGCGFANTSVLQGAGFATIYNANFSGNFTGDIDTLTVTLFVSGVRANSGQTNNVNTILGIDGKSMFGTVASTTGTPGPGNKAVTVKPTATTTPGVFKLEYSITNIGFIGDSGADHVVQLSVTVSTDPATLVLLDTAETPSGITFAPAVLAAAKLKATTPGPAA